MSKRERARDYRKRLEEAVAPFRHSTDERDRAYAAMVLLSLSDAQKRGGLKRVVRILHAVEHLLPRVKKGGAS